ncbi:DoxX family protein [Moheibacter stercoris]|uniref:Methylamine utilisation protein MauE domain-containing protein n=1 Tax=Moheibacter stercoris TaxID=1628251 RepID=A0ABV2LPR0_9FLAO
MKLKISKAGFLDLICYLFVLLFVYASVSKLLEFQDFQTQLGQSPLLGAFAIPISYGVILVELGLAVLLCLEKYRRIGLYGSFVLMVMFTAYIIIILNFTSFTPCSCGGVLESLGWTEHLIFNVAFIVLAGIGIYLQERKFSRPLVYRLIGLKFLGSLLVLLIFLSSEKEIKRNNAFQRKYMPHGLEELGSLQLESNAFYIAGIDDSLIYLGNYNAPLYLKAVSKDLSCWNEIKIELENYDLPYKRVRIEVQSPYFFVGDGTVPVLFRGNISDWKAYTFSYEDAFFYDFKVQDSASLIFTTTSSSTGNTVLGHLQQSDDSIDVVLNRDLLKVQLDGVFDTDGVLLWDVERQKTAYVYYYRNQYEVADRNLVYQKTGKTIDTISHAQIDVAYYKGEDSYKKGKSTLVHKTGAVYGNQLYVNSDRLGKFESEEVLRSASIIDQYDVERNEYIHSFYFYHQPEQKLREFKVVKDTIIGMVDNKLWIQRIKPEFFKY